MKELEESEEKHWKHGTACTEARRHQRACVLSIFGHSVCPVSCWLFLSFFRRVRPSHLVSGALLDMPALGLGAVPSSRDSAAQFIARRLEAAVRRRLPVPSLSQAFLSSGHTRGGGAGEVLSASCDQLGSSSVARPRAHTSRGLQVQSRVSNSNTPAQALSRRRAGGESRDWASEGRALWAPPGGPRPHLQGCV